MRSRRPSKRSYRPSRTSPTVAAPSTVVSPSPPVTLRSCVGILTVTAMRAEILDGRAGGKGRLERRDAGVDLVGLERAAHRVERLQALAGDHRHDALVRIDLAARRQLRERRGGHAA